MTFEILHIHIKRELIRTFAIADEWLDRAFDLQSSNDKLAAEALRQLDVLLSENELLISSIKDYRFCDVPLDYQYDVKRELHEILEKQFTARGTVFSELPDLRTLRRKLRNQLLDCLLVLELPEPGKRAEIILAIHDAIEIDSLDLLLFLTDKIRHRLDYLAIQKNSVL